MSMKDIREKFDVPAKRGMTVKPKSGYNQGLLGYIRGSSGNMLVVASNRGPHPGWVSVLHPLDVDFLGKKPTNGSPGD